MWNAICLALGCVEMFLFALIHAGIDAGRDPFLYTPMYIVKMFVDFGVCALIAYALHFMLLSSSAEKAKYFAFGFIGFVMLKAAIYALFCGWSACSHEPFTLLCERLTTPCHDPSQVVPGAARHLHRRRQCDAAHARLPAAHRDGRGQLRAARRRGRVSWLPAAAKERRRRRSSRRVQTHRWCRAERVAADGRAGLQPGDLPRVSAQRERPPARLAMGMLVWPHMRIDEHERHTRDTWSLGRHLERRAQRKRHTGCITQPADA